MSKSVEHDSSKQVTDGLSRRQVLKGVGSIGIIAVTAGWLAGKVKASERNKLGLAECGDDQVELCICDCGGNCSDCGVCGACMCPAPPLGSGVTTAERMVAASAETKAGNTNMLVVSTQTGSYSDGRVDLRDAQLSAQDIYSKVAPDASYGWVAGSTPAKVRRSNEA